jgi:hypothetical protein
VEPDTLTVREPSLDDVFIALTGRHVEGQEDTDDTEDSVQSPASGRPS